jgi:3alpha(or 20beta)-hydroxysteroid dehydrogenase
MEMAMGRLENKVAIVTGGSGGIGEAITRLFVAEGAKVLIADINDELGEALSEELGDSVRHKHLDVGVSSQFADAVSAAEREFGSLNILVNNAGVHTTHDILSSPESDFDRIVNVNQRGVFNGIRAAVPALLRAGGGAIINASSIGGLLGLGGAATIYRGTKFAVRGLTRTAAHDLAGTGIRVNAVLPGAIRTDMYAHGNHADHEDKIIAAIPLRRVGLPREAANAYLFLASDDASYITGAEIVVDGGWSC